MNTFLVTIQRKDQVLGREVDKETFTVGRSLECDISLNDNHVSRVHLVISRRWNQVWIEDKNSSNGTFVNGTKIVQGTPVNVVATDKIQIGRSEYVLTIDLKTDEIQAPTEPEVELPAEEEPIEATVAMPAPSFAQPFQAEKALHEAKRKAAQIILEGETQAEKRVQAIYQKAREAQSQGEMFYQTRIAEAHKEADAILNDYQQQGRTLIQEARNMAQELREEVDLYVQSLRQKAKADADDVISEATLAAERMKSEAVAAGRDQALRDSELTIKNAKEEAERVLDFSRLQSQELQDRIKHETEELEKLAATLKETEEKLATGTKDLEETLKKDEELKVAVAQEDQRLKDLIMSEEARVKAHVESEESRVRDFVQTEEEKIKTFVASEKTRLEETYNAEEKRLVDLRTAEEKRVSDLLAKEESRVNELVAGEASRVKEILDKEESEVKRLKALQEELTQQKVKLDASVASLTQQQAHLTMDVRDVEAKKDHLFKDYESKKIFLNEKLEQEKTQMVKTEEQRLEEMRMEMSKRLQKMERELLDEVLKKKTSMVKEIHSVIEKEVVKIVEPAKWRDISTNVEAHILESIEGKVSTMSQSSVTSEKPVDFLKKKKREQMRWMATGLAMGMALLFVGQTVTQMVRQDLTPMQTAVTNEAKKRQEELEKRRFNPAQTEEVKDTYTDAVIYTRNFVTSYTDEDFQQRLYKASSAYLLKTWRVDEDNSIKVIAAANALVKDLADRRANIHPDFVKDGIQKMRDLEKDTLFRMKEILGTEVRVESFRKFERNFYKEDQQKRKISQH